MNAINPKGRRREMKTDELVPPKNTYLRQMTGGGATPVRTARWRPPASIFEIFSDCLPMGFPVSEKVGSQMA